MQVMSLNILIFEVQDNCLALIRSCHGKCTRTFFMCRVSIEQRQRRTQIDRQIRETENVAPNGAKVDVSTMLEEAAHYVKVFAASNQGKGSQILNSSILSYY